MRNFFVLLVASLSLAGIATAQSNNATATISGTLVDSTSHEAIGYATVKVYAVPPAALPAKVGVADAQGKFSIVVPSAENYTVQCEFLGKATLRIPVAVQGRATVALGRLLMGDGGQQLQAVTVISQKPLVQVDLDKITYDMAQDPDAKTNTTLDMLKKVPLVTVDGEENVQLKGSSNFVYYLNGKPSKMLSNNPKDVLKSIPANTVKNIEVITDPGAKYDAEGVAGIINIVTDKQSQLGGYTGSVNAGGNTRGAGSGTGFGSTYFSLKYGKLGITANLGGTLGKNPKQRSSTFRENYTSDELHFLTQEGSSQGHNRNFYGGGEISYEFDSLNLLNVNFNIWRGSSTSEQLSHFVMQDIGHADVYKYDQTGSSSGGWSGSSVGADYQRTFAGVKDRLLTLSYRYDADGDASRSNTDIAPLLGYLRSATQQHNDAGSGEHTAQLDFTTPIAKIHTVEAGAKYIRRLNESESGTRSGISPDSLVDVPSDNDRFRHVQDIFAAYAGYSVKLKKWGGKVGARLEGTRLRAEYPLNGQRNFGASYLNVVPSATVTYMPKPAQTLRLSYNMRILRPGIYQLNPYVDSTDVNFLSYGNPELDAVMYHNAGLAYNMFKQKVNMNLNLSYSYTGNGVTSFMWMENNRSHTTYRNIAQEQRLNLSGYVSVTPTTKLRISANLGLGYSDLRANDNSGLHNSGFSGYAYGMAQYTFPLDFVLSMQGQTNIGEVQLQSGKRYMLVFHGLSLSKSFLNKKLNLRLSVTNPFKANLTFEGTQQSSDYRYATTTVLPFRAVSFSASFRFGKMKAQIKKAQRSITNDDTMGGGSSSSSEGSSSSSEGSVTLK